MTFHQLVRITEKVSLARSLSVLGDHAGADEVWTEVQADVASDGYQLGLGSPSGSPAEPHPLIEANALGATYHQAFEDGQSVRASLHLAA